MRLFVAFISVFFLLSIPLLASGQPKPGWIGYTWKSEYCEQTIDTQKCQGSDYIQPEDEFGIKQDTQGNPVVFLKKAQGTPLEFPVTKLDFSDPNAPTAWVEATFTDTEVTPHELKQLHLEILHLDGAPDLAACKAQLDRAFPSNRDPAEIKRQCELDDLIYWRIKPFSASMPKVWPPGDGHGTGSGGDTGEG